METKEILDLFEKFENSSLSEISIKKGQVEVMMKKGGMDRMPAHIEYPPFIKGQPQHQDFSQIEKDNKPVQKQEGTEIIASPMVGTLYRAPASDAPPFVNVGSKVKAGQTLCVLEAMKLMNELEVEFDCEIVSILVENGKMVEFGTPLFEVKK